MILVFGCTSYGIYGSKIGTSVLLSFMCFMHRYKSVNRVRGRLSNLDLRSLKLPLIPGSQYYSILIADIMQSSKFHPILACSFVPCTQTDSFSVWYMTIRYTAVCAGIIQSTHDGCNTSRNRGACVVLLRTRSRFIIQTTMHLEIVSPTGNEFGFPSDAAYTYRKAILS